MLGTGRRSGPGVEKRSYSLRHRCSSAPTTFSLERLPSSQVTMSNGIVRRRGSIDIVDAKVAVNLATAQSYKENVFLFTPNLIGA